eukprot:XP_011669446.1 PREDICTED: uncharacterized protein LOC577080 isoform X2 [Strongylocentrotus purpuratus]
MPRNTDSGSSNTGIVTRSSASLIEGDVGNHLQLTVPCKVTLDKLRQSSKKLVLKHGSGYYTLTRGESLRYRIEGIKVLRTKNRSMPTATQKGGSKMNRPDPRDKGYRHIPQSRESGFSNNSYGDYHKQGQFDGRYPGPYRSRGQDNRFEQRRHWSPRGNYGNRGSRDPYGRDYNNSREHFGRRASSYPDEAMGERRIASSEGRFERFPPGDRESSLGSQDRPGRYPDQHAEKRRHLSGSSLDEQSSKSLASTYRRAGIGEQSNHAVSLNACEKEDSNQSNKEPKENVLNNDRTTLTLTSSKDKAGSPADSQGLSNSHESKATQKTPTATAKPNTNKHKKKIVLTMSQQIESLRSYSPKANVVENKEMSAKNSEDANVETSTTGNGENHKGSPHRTEISIPKHIDGKKPSAKGTEATSSSGEAESASTSPRRVHSARKSVPSSSVSRTQKSDMLKKQALLRSQSDQNPPAASNASSRPTARMGVKETKSGERDSDQGSPIVVVEGKDASVPTNDDTSRVKEVFTPPPVDDIVVLSDTEDNMIEISSQDKGSTKTGTGDAKTLTPSPSNASTSGGNLTMSSELHSKVDDKASAQKVTSEESVLQNSQDVEQGDKVQNMTSDEAATSETRDAVKVDDPKKSLDVEKITGKGLLKITEKLKKNLLKGKVSPQTSSPSSRVGSRSSSNSSVEIPIDTTKVTDQADSHQREVDDGSVATSTCLEIPNTEGQVSSGIPDTVPKVDGKEVCEDNIIHVPKLSAPCTGNDDVADCIAVDMMDDDKQASQSDDLHCIGGDTQPFLVSTEPAADDTDHICNDVLDDSSKITSPPEKSDYVNSPVVGDEILQTASSLPKQSEEASKKDDSTLAKVGDSVGDVEDLSDGSVDLGPHEPGDMDSVDDDLLLEDEPVMISELYNPEPEKMDTSETPEPQDSQVSELPESQEVSEVSELAIARVESQSEDVLQQVVSDKPSSSSKRTLTEDSEDAEEGPVSKKSRTETADIIEGIEIPGTGETADSDANKKPVIFTHSEWKEFAQSIKEKYEKLVQTFNQKTNVMYEAQAHWQQETVTWKKNYEELELKYENLALQVKEKSVAEKQNVGSQTTFTHKTKLSRKKKGGTRQAPQETPSQEEEAMETEQGTTSSSDAPASSSGPPPTQTTSDCSPSAAATSSRSNSDPVSPGTLKPTNLESKRKVFKATLNKVMQRQKNLSGASEAGTSSDAPSSGKSSPVVASPMKTSTTNESTEEPGSSDGATALTPKTNQTVSRDSPMDTSHAGSKTTDSPAANTASTESMSTKGPNVAITASGTATAASRPQETSSSKPTPSNTGNANLSSVSKATSSQAIPSPCKSLTSTAGAIHAASPSKAQSESSVKTNVPSATDSSKLPGSPKHSTNTASTKVPETSKDTGPQTNKDSLVSKPTKSVQVQDEPEVIDLTDEPDPPAKPSAPSPHKQQDAQPASKHTTLTTRSPHALVNSPPVSSPNTVVSRATSVSAGSSSITAPAASGTVSANTRQVQSGTPNLVSQNATQRPGQRSPAVQPASQTRTGSTSRQIPSPKRSSPGVPQSVSPQGNKQSSSAANLQLRNVNPPVVTTLLQGTNVRPQVVSLQHGPRQNQIAPAGRGHPATSQVAVSQVPIQQQQTTTISSLQPGLTTIQNQARMQGHVAIQQRLQQQQQRISLQMLQQGRQGVHQLPGAAASAAALAIRQPGPTWLQQPRQQLQVTSTQQPGSAQLALQQQQQQQQQNQHYQNLARSQAASTQDQIQAQERAHAANHAQAVAKAAREQREQEQHQQARIAAQRLQSSQLEQQQTQMVQIKKLQEEMSVIQTKAQQHRNKKRLILSQIKRGEEYQQALRSKLSGSKQSGMNRQVFQSCQRQLQDVQEQERKLRSELNHVEKGLEECRLKSNQLDQHIHLATTAAASRLSPQELQKHQLQQQQQQLSQQLAQRQIQQQQQQKLQQQQQQQQQQVQLQQQKANETTRPKHPAQLPDLNIALDVPRQSLYTPMPIKPVLEIKHSQEGIVLSWKADPDGGASKIDVKRYLLYAYQESESATPNTDLWKKIGAVDALPLPMACTLTHFKAGSMYHFAVCAISKHSRPGVFSNIGSINLP